MSALPVRVTAALLLAFSWPTWLPTGCQRKAEDLQAVKSRVLAADEKFSAPLAKHDELANQLQVLDRELQLKRTQIEDQIAKLRGELLEATKQSKQQAEQLKAQLNPEVERVELALAMAKEEQKSKRRQRGALGRSVSKLRKSIKQAQDSQAGEDPTKLSQELTNHLEEMTRLDKELASLGQHIELLEDKRQLLKL